MGTIAAIPLHLAQSLACIPGALSDKTEEARDKGDVFSNTEKSLMIPLSSLKTCPAPGSVYAREFKTNHGSSEGFALTVERRSEFPGDGVEYPYLLLTYVLTTLPELWSPLTKRTSK